MLPTPTFSSMLILARQNDMEAINFLYIEAFPRVSRYVARHVPPAAVEDVTSDVFCKMVQDIWKLRARDEAAFFAWIFTIVQVRVAEYHRKMNKEDNQGNRVQVFPLDDEAYSIAAPDDPTQVVEAIELRTAIGRALAELPTDKRQIVDGRFFLGQSPQVLAQRFGKSPEAIYNDQYRALQKMSKNSELRQIWVVRIILFFVAGSLFFAAGIAVVSNAEPGNILYPIKQWGQQIFSSDSGDSRHDISTPTDTPTSVPTLIPTPSPSPTPTSTPITIAVTSTPQSLAGQVLNTVATALPLTSPSSDTGPATTCVLGACINSTLP